MWEEDSAYSINDFDIKVRNLRLTEQNSAIIMLPWRDQNTLLNLSYNKLTEIDPSAFEGLSNLQEVRLNNNDLTAIPSLGPTASSVRSLHLHHNKIRSIEASQLKPYVTLETLDLSFNDITEIRNGCFPQGLHIKELYLGSNRISTLEPGAFDSLSRSLLTLRLSKNRITQLPVKAFRLPRLIQL
ncbi:leucine-rich repeats and immunoglobulin-like domains protein 1 [Cariama cristata]